MELFIKYPEDVQSDVFNYLLRTAEPTEYGRKHEFKTIKTYEQFSQTYDLIFGRWLPESGETLRDAPCLERYLNRDPRRTKVENLRTEIFVPID